MNRNKFLFVLACLLLGFASILSQIILFRELLAVFYGNELCLGILLFVWFLWVGLGSKLGNVIAVSKSSLLKHLSFWYFLLAIFSILTIIGIRYSRIVLNVLPGEIIGFVPMLIFTFLILGPLCLILGILFVLNSTVWHLDPKLGKMVTKVYLWESLGAGLGGFLGSLVLIPHLSNFSVQSWLFMVLFLFSILLWVSFSKGRRMFFFLGAIIVVLAFKIGKLDTYLEGKSLNKLWRGQPVVKSVDSIYGNLVILKNKEQISLYENGLLLFSYPDEFSSEEAVLFAVAEHPEPKRLLLIGGGAGGTLTQALKYKDLKIDYVELDPKIIELGENFLPDPEVGSLKNERVTIIHKDGRLFVRQKADEGVELYDLIVPNLPDPYNAQLNRFYTKEFFGLVKKLLLRDGIFSFRATSSENYLNPEQALYISSLYRTLSSEFKSVIVLPGSNNVFLASQGENLTYDWMKISESLKNKNIQTTYINEHFLSNRLSPERIEYLLGIIQSVKGKINYDLKPISYFYNAVLWSTQLRSVEKSVFNFLAKLDPLWYFLVGSALSFSFLFLIFRRKKFVSGLSLYAIFVAGFSSIIFEISIILIYQVFYGYVYSKIGLFLTLFMLGLFTGALYIDGKKVITGVKNLTWLQSLQLVLILLFLFLISGFLSSQLSPRILETILGGMIFFSGFIGGAIFTCANQLYLQIKQEKKAGTGYALDLFGSAFSSILISAIFIPLLGISSTLWLIFLLNFILWGFLYLSSFRTKTAQL
ncbi:MAG: fused MFS/spermidine synthase [candidate division Zixibacteria bacterium]|nr:fused MFS/spermidine synthase [candidate division Zixibacteria bacterium]